MCDYSPTSSHHHDIEKWKIKKLIDDLKRAKGNGTSMVSMIIPPKDQMSRVAQFLASELTAGDQIKSKLNKQSVHSAISFVQEKIKLYQKVPPNGLVIFSGIVVTENEKDRKIIKVFEPFKPINTSLYQCDKRFHTEALERLLADNPKYGFIVIDGKGALFGTLEGNVRQVICKLTVDMPKKHGRGGQSVMRYARQRTEKRHNFMRKVAERSLIVFMSNDDVNVKGIVLAGIADFKTELFQSDLLDTRIQAIVIKTVDIAYGGEHGFNQAIDLAADSLQHIKFVQEKKKIQNYFKEVSEDSGKYCFGVANTLHALEQGGAETIICWEDLKIERYVMKSKDSNQEIIRHLKPDQEKDNSCPASKNNGAELIVVKKDTLLKWLIKNYNSFGAKLVLISDNTMEGSQFVQGFGGLGALLRYKIDFQYMEDDEEVENFVDINDY